MSVINNSCSWQLMILRYISYSAHSTDGDNIYCAVAQYRLCKSVRLFDGFVWNNTSNVNCATLYKVVQI